MKPFYLTILLTLLTTATYAGDGNDTTKRDTTLHVLEQVPEFPGGTRQFYKYLEKQLKYPEVAQLIGIDGQVVVSFIIEKDGKVSGVTPVKCLGAGCDAEAVRIIAESPQWKPGVQKGKPVRVQYNVPISFKIAGNDNVVNMKALRKSDYGFIFQINGAIYTMDQAEEKLGHKFKCNQIAEAVPYEGSASYQMPDKKAVYIVVMK